MSNIANLKGQVEVTIKALELKRQSSSEPVIDEYLKKYKDVLKAIENGSSESDVHKLANKLLNCARGYMETSSNYQQDFLNEMGKTEKIVKQLLT
ncbi:hypothetical protein V2P20_05550 [Methylobacter sp. Wu1]|uniref:hypothetical protein n=1 Tax=Methylobacter sp. Wu1 TaxID=3119359 RepID=UPI002F92D527